MDAANFRYDHPRGPIFAYIGDHGVRNLVLPPAGAPAARVHMLHSAPNRVLGRTLHDALERYFAGQRESFKHVPLDLQDGTAFQQDVWRAAIENAPWGTTATYADLAKAMDRDRGSARAIGAALGRNPIQLLVPCHRFIGANGKLVDFAAGLAWKEELLQLEGALL